MVTDLPNGPTPLQLLLTSKQLDITYCFEVLAKRARPPDNIIPLQQSIHVTIKGRNKRARPPTDKFITQLLNTTPISYRTILPAYNTPVSDILQTSPPKFPTNHETLQKYRVHGRMEPSRMPLPHCASTPTTQSSNNLHQYITRIYHKPTDNSRGSPPPCVHCLKGEGDSGDPGIIQCGQ
jgi:hypothetical protein